MATVTLANTTANLSGAEVVKKDGTHTITGTITFDKDPSAPFAVTSGSAVVTNLDADMVDGYEAAELAALAEDETVAGDWTFSGATTFTGAAVVGSLRGTPETITATGTVNDQALGATTTILRCNNASLLTLTGFTGGAAGRVLIVQSVGAGIVALDHQTGSTAANQLFNLATSGMTQLAAGVGTAIYYYDGTKSRWVLVHHEQGAWITRTFAAGDYTGDSSMTVTVASGDVSQDKHYLKGRTLHYGFELDTISIGGTPSTDVQIAIPAGFTGDGRSNATTLYSDNGGAHTAGRALVLASAAVVTCRIAAGAPWAGFTNATNIYGQIAIAVT